MNTFTRKNDVSQYIKVTENAGWAEIRLNRPAKLNALRVDMCQEIADTAERLAQRPDIKCLVFSGEGPHFSAGYDVATEHATSDPKDMWLSNRSVQTAFARLNDLPVVTICAMQGYVVGAGMLLATHMTCP